MSLKNCGNHEGVEAILNLKNQRDRIQYFGVPFKKYIAGWVRWLTPIIPALCEAKVGASLGQEFETSLTNMVKSHLY